MWSRRRAPGGPGAPWCALPPGRAARALGHPGVHLRPRFSLLPSFLCINFCYIFARIVPATYLAISCVFFSICFCQGIFQLNLGAMASPSSPKDKFVVNVINPYLAEVKKHPQVVRMEDGVLHQEDLKGPIKEGSVQARLEEVEQEVFKYKKMTERGVEANFDITNELKNYFLKEMWERIAASEDRIIELQGQINDLHNQNCEYELRFMRMSLGAECRIQETSFSYETGEPLPWKRFAKDYVINANKDDE